MNYPLFCATRTRRQKLINTARVGSGMLNRPTESELLKLAGIKIDKNTPLEHRVIHMHFFLDGHDWYLAEYDPQRRRFFGYWVPNQDYQRARWDFFGLDELDQMRNGTNAQLVRNPHWKPKRAIDVDRIRDAYAWRRNLEMGLKKAKRRIARDSRELG